MTKLNWIAVLMMPYATFSPSFWKRRPRKRREPWLLSRWESLSLLGACVRSLISS